MADLPDEERMSAVAQGNQGAFSALVSAYAGYAHAIALRFLGNRADAEEAVQEAFTKVWVHAARFDPAMARFKTWFTRILTNTCRDRIRRTNPAADNIEDWMDILPGSDTTQDATLSNTQECQRIRRAVQSLPDRQRMAVILCYFEDLTNPEAAAAMGVHIKALEGLLVRARKILKKELGET